VKDIAEGLEVKAAAPDGIVEAVCKPDQRFLWAVQWHPEFAYRTDENSRKIFSAVVEARERALFRERI
jgi:putative glutamine amidotransferase